MPRSRFLSAWRLSHASYKQQHLASSMKGSPNKGLASSLMIRGDGGPDAKFFKDISPRCASRLELFTPSFVIGLKFASPFSFVSPEPDIRGRRDFHAWREHPKWPGMEIQGEMNEREELNGKVVTISDRRGLSIGYYRSDKPHGLSLVVSNNGCAATVHMEDNGVGSVSEVLCSPKMAKMLAQEELAAMSSADEDDYAPAARAT